MIKVILFDADGVLINGERFSECLERDYGITTKITTPFFNGPFEECIVGNADLKEVLKPHIEEWGWKGTIDDLLDYWFRVEHKLNEDLIGYIQSLREKGILCCIATNQEKYRVKYMLEHMGFSNSFDKVYASAHLGHKKPSQEFYAKVLEDLKVEKEEVLFWDDDLKNVKGAKEFGIKAELYTSFENFIQYLENSTNL